MKEAEVYYDGHCPLCCAAAFLARDPSFVFHSFRDAAPQLLPVHPQALEEAMAVKTRDGTLYMGFDGLLYLARHLPRFWLFYPILWLLGRKGLGPRLYRFVAQRRPIRHRQTDGRRVSSPREGHS
ncbi:MAG: DUF393 domain-containing protein [Clostridiales bacterium]|nr:DUF393 domain-containing protein [Clostridiales bacterium]